MIPATIDDDVLYAIRYAGYRVVPAVPTAEMVEAALKAGPYCGYEAVEAAIAVGAGDPWPPPPKEEPPPVGTFPGYDQTHPLYGEVRNTCACCLYYIPDGERPDFFWGDCVLKGIPGLENAQSLDDISEELPCNLFTVMDTHTCEKHEECPVRLAIALKGREKEAAR